MMFDLFWWFVVEINTATIVELLNLIMSLCIILISVYASNKFTLRIFRRGWFVVGISAVIMLMGSIFRSYYSHMGVYEEWAWLGRIFVFFHLLFLVIGIYMLATTAVRMWGD